MNTKECSKCKKIKPLSEFDKEKNGKFGKRADCKVCKKEYKKEYIKNNREKLLKNQRERRLANIEKERERERRNYHKNHKQTLERKRKWRDENREKLRSKDKERYYANHEKAKKEKREWQKRNGEKRRNYRNKRRKENPAFRLEHCLRSRFSSWLKAKGQQKTNSITKLIGISWKEFSQYIESLWEPWMNWDNHGIYESGGPKKWHIDHIEPCNKFNPTDPEDMKACWYYTNLRPLEAIENITRGARKKF